MNKYVKIAEQIAEDLYKNEMGDDLPDSQVLGDGDQYTWREMAIDKAVNALQARVKKMPLSQANELATRGINNVFSKHFGDPVLLR